ncbi:nitrate reductase cytochrome c-type subunit [Magnetospira sp. QH-2]|uniref:nitrate reductase cytochrome c-type subunit n=1 Tax=Magnetospira sp. (strain QH-2) TaxID=1288970 RepID=UPI0003E8172F|nr:nitrate reductase cytochrome c-type subunit [Magnetospira sp. QH-2]CCQ73125.1 Diheme cytochrome c NapB [Magnetospira sp. QH-2]
MTMTHRRGDLAVKKLLTIGMVAGALILGLVTSAQADVETLRGEQVDTKSLSTPVPKLVIGTKFERTFRQQPPMVSHEVDKYQINIKANECIKCHDWRYAAKEKAPEMSKPHYKDRNGEEWDEVTRGRWFCTQCHAAQTNVMPLVENTFTSK